MAFETKSDPMLVAAIDFGTTFSGYAFAFKADYKDDPLKISGYTWTLGSAAGLSLKTPTCVLFDKHGDFHSFGNEAEDKYTQLAEAEEHRDWYYFRRFKMQLYKSHVSKMEVWPLVLYNSIRLFQMNQCALCIQMPASGISEILHACPMVKSRPSIFCKFT